jgi:hypothetical protein
VVAVRVRVSPEEKLCLDAATVALDLGRLGIDDAAELADRVFVTTLLDEELPGLHIALLRFKASWFRYSGPRGAYNPNSSRKHHGQHNHGGKSLSHVDYHFPFFLFEIVVRSLWRRRGIGFDASSSRLSLHKAGKKGEIHHRGEFLSTCGSRTARPKGWL